MSGLRSCAKLAAAPFVHLNVTLWFVLGVRSFSTRNAAWGVVTAWQPAFGPPAHPEGATQVSQSGQTVIGPPTQAPLLQASAVVHALLLSPALPLDLNQSAGHAVLAPVQ